LARQRANDKLCRDFAAVADPFTKQIDADKDTITKSQAELEQQLAFVEERTKLAASNDKLEAIKALQAKIEQAGIKNNPHSPITARDAEVQWKQYNEFLATKRTALAEQIEHKKLRGVTPEQYAEIKSNFTQYDKDKSGHIDGKELRACLYSLGYEKSKNEVKAIMEELGVAVGAGKELHYDGFKEFMIRQLGDNDTTEEILEGYSMISRGLPSGQNEWSDQVLKEEEVAYLRTESPKAGNGGADYAGWLKAALAR